MQKPADPATPRLQRLLRHNRLSPLQWRRRLLFWCGAVAVALAAIVFAKLSTLAYQTFVRMIAHRSWSPLLLTPCVFALLAWLTSGALKATRGSGIPQAIAALQIEDENFRHRLLSLRIAAGKMALPLAGLLADASIGREGPTVHFGAGLLYSLGRRFGFVEPAAAGRFVPAGAAAGLAAAFNRPLAGVVFAIEEMAGAFEHRMSGIILTAVIIAGIVTLGLLGNYAYFGTVTTALPLGQSWLAVLICGALCGLAGGLFARLILLSASLLSGGALSHVAKLRARFPIRSPPRADWRWRSSDSPAPTACTVPATTRHARSCNRRAMQPGAPAAAVVLLGMAGYLAGVTQAPLTSAIISVKLTDNQVTIIPILAVCLIARGASALFCPVPVYRAFAQRLIAEHERDSQPGTGDSARQGAAPG